MKKIIESITDIVRKAFGECGYKEEYGMVIPSKRPDLCQYQCNGALMAAKEYRKNPMQIASEVTSRLFEQEEFQKVEPIKPGFINLILKDEIITDYLNTMVLESKYGCEEIGKGKTIIADYGGPNVAKPLHVGHLRSAIIGESIKRTGRYLGYNILGDVHLGDWGLQIGLLIAEFKKRNPESVYFDENHDGDYPEQSPFTISELEEIYPTASACAKTNPDFKEEAKNITVKLQNGNTGYNALWQHIMKVSIEDLKKNYSRLNVSFDLWKKESDVQPYIPGMVDQFKKSGHAYISEGALVVDVKEETDTREIPPCLILKSDGGSLYGTTDLATIAERVKLFDPDEIIYIVDKRQELHFTQVFRCAMKTGLIPQEKKLTFLGFGTMNGSDGRPFKTRDGDVMRLEKLIKLAYDKVFARIADNKDISKEETEEIAARVGVAALKYSDLSNQISKDYSFDLDRFTAAEGNTGPYIIYTVVRIKSILKKLTEHGHMALGNRSISSPCSDTERKLMIKTGQVNEVLENSFMEYAPHRICQYIFELSNEFNRFYHENNILHEKDSNKQQSWISLIKLVKDILITCLDLLGIEVPEKM